ncbi:recombinase family protein [Mucilaginibacter aquatilis]|uniref:Recombinase family protein n=1 Tax=Mucilaginibacter aquatilis TaxID=1517760 RepID=A0A6I4IA02_9SPHI|nr:recombinase family protein [Mucilaginibacter aquatilis]MVN92035.1 recombinase family protein [Mucilaginibacter aquatilis]
MKVKYNRVSTLNQTGNRFLVDNEKYDLVLLDKVSGNLPFQERPKGKQLMNLVNEGLVTEIIVEEFSRLGRNTGDVINTLEWLDNKNVNVIVRNIAIQSRPNGIKNPIWSMISSIMASLYQMELENIKERTMVGRMVYLQKGGKLGRPQGAKESEKEFMNKPTSQAVIKSLKKGLTIREIGKINDVSTKTVIKIKKILELKA